MANNKLDYFPVQNENEIKVLTKLFPDIEIYTVNKLGFIHHLNSLSNVERVTQKEFGETFGLTEFQVKTIVRKRGQVQISSFGKGVDSVHIEPTIKELSLGTINQPININNEDTPATGGEVSVNGDSENGAMVENSSSSLVDKNLGVGDSTPFSKELTIEQRVVALEKKVKTLTKIIKNMANEKEEK